MRDLGVTAAIKLQPAGALAGLAKREWKGGTSNGDVEVLALAGRGDLDRARALIDAARGRPEAEHQPDWRVVVAPVPRNVRPPTVAAGTRVAARTPPRCIRSRRAGGHVPAGHAGVLPGRLGEGGGPGRPGR